MPEFGVHDATPATAADRRERPRAASSATTREPAKFSGDRPAGAPDSFKLGLAHARVRVVRMSGIPLRRLQTVTAQ